MKRITSILSISLFVFAIGLAPVVNANSVNEDVTTHLTEKEKEGKKDKKNKKKKCCKKGEEKACCKADSAEKKGCSDEGKKKGCCSKDKATS